MNYARFDLVTLNLFVEIARTGSITRGAQQSNLAVAAASKRISDLETHLGTRLLYRHANGVTLTDAGRACFQHALGILQDIDKMSGALSDFAAGSRGQVRIWANTSAVTQFLPDDLTRFRREHPGIQISLEERTSGDVVAAVRENRADIGIFADRTAVGDIEVFDYRKDRLVLIVSPDHPLATRESVQLGDALDYEFVSLSEATSLAERLRAECTRLEKPLKLSIQVRSFDAVCKMVMVGLGIGVLPYLAAEPHVRSMGLKLITLTDDWAERTLLLALRSTLAPPAPVRLLASCLSADAARAINQSQNA